MKTDFDELKRCIMDPENRKKIQDIMEISLIVILLVCGVLSIPSMSESIDVTVYFVSAYILTELRKVRKEASKDDKR